MFDCTKDLQDYYDNHVRLGADLRGRLASARDTNLDRLEKGLQEIGAERKKTYRGPIETRNQGSYAMHTLNKSDEYDIDVALIFRKEDLPADPLEARQLVRDALLKKCTNFAKEPEARTNAVTVWYQDGYHLDFAVFRTWTESGWFEEVTKLEHASSGWQARDPSEINDWFAKAVEAKSPKPENLIFSTPPKVAPGQLRRVVRFAKRFCISRTSFCLPGGMIVSALIVETYVPDKDRDDVSLYRTLESLKNRLAFSVKVFNPLNSQIELTAKSEFLNEVKRLNKELDKNFAKLAVLHKSDCTNEQARGAWDWIFNHEFWQTPAKKYESALQKSTTIQDSRMPYYVQVSCKLTRGKGGLSYTSYKNGGSPLPKGIGLRFSVEQTNCPGPYETHWLAENEGDEAADAHQLKWDKFEERCETSTQYRGRQRMTCRLEKGGKVVGESVFIVNIA
jgi:hypothetical protein